MLGGWRVWKWVLLTVVVLAATVGGIGFYLSDKIYPRFDHAVVTPAGFDHKFTPAQLAEDFRYLTATVEHIHPDITAITDTAAYPQQKAAALAQLDHPMTRTEFYRVVAPFDGAAYADGHTEILTLYEEWDAYKAAGGTVPPFAIRIADGHIVVAATLDASIPAGAELVSLNGVTEADLVKWLVGTQSVETQAGREAFGARRFPDRVWAYGLRPPFVAVYRAPGGATQTATSPGIPIAMWAERLTIGSNQPVSLSIENGVAYIAIADFSMPWDKYESWLKDAFQKIHDAHASALILDLRNNSGGDTRQSDMLQTYLSAKQLPAMEEVAVHATPEIKAMYRTLLPEGFRWIPLNSMIPELAGIQDAPDNGTFTTHPEGTAPSERSGANPLLFTGDLYVLISPITYSTALIAVVPYQYWKRGTLVGETTSEPTTFFGDYYEFDLPNTKLQMHVSHKRFRLFGSHGRAGLKPDVAISPAEPDARAIALRLIAERRHEQ